MRAGRTALALLLAGGLLAACEGLPGYTPERGEADNSNLDPAVSDLPEAVPLGDPPLPPRRPDVGTLALAPPMAAPLDEATQEPPKVDTLVGLDFAETENLLGAPTLQEVQPPAQVWSYNGPDCVLTIFFYPQVEGERFRALAYDVSEPVPNEQSAQRCFTALVAEYRAGQQAPDAPQAPEEPGISSAPAGQSGARVAQGRAADTDRDGARSGARGASPR
jgi:hypothetical protein